MLKIKYLLLLLLISIKVFATDTATTIYTPEGRPVTAYIMGNGALWYDDEDAQDDIDIYGLDAEIIESSTRSYNCHGYAWTLSENSGTYWIGYTDNDEEIKYFNDASYSNDSQASYVSSSSSLADHGCYEQYSDHSVRVIQNGYPVAISGARTHVSKWACGPLVRQAPGHDIFALKNTSIISYYKLKTAHSGTLSSYPKTWVGAGEVNHSISSNVSVPSGATLTIKSDAIANLGSYSIVSTGGTITIESGATINSSNSHVRLTNGSTINGLYPTIASAAAAASSGQTIEIYGPHTLTTNYSIPSVVSLSVKSGATLTLGSYSIVSSGGTITVASDATLSPDVRRKSGSTILGLYPSITSALSAASSSQTVEYGGSHTMSSNLTVSSGITLSAKAGSTLSFASGYYLSVNGTLNASGTSVSRATFTRSGASGTWGGIRYQSGSSGTLSYGTISYVTYGVYLNSSSPDVDHCNISSCSYGVYCTGASPDITNNTISSSSYGIYCTSASPDICNNTVSGSSTYGLYVYNGSPDLETNQVTGSQVYMNACDSYMYDNYFVNASSCNQALYLYGSSPSLFNNTIDPSEVMLAINITNDSDPWFGDYPGLGHNYIYNENFEADGVIWATNYSNPILGYGDAGPYIGGSNSIIGVTGIYPATAFNNSSIDAAWCWWGQYPAPACYGNVDTHDALSSDPGGGSSLAKSTYLAGDIIVDESVSSPADSLYKIGMSLFVEKQYESAIPVFKKLIIDYPDTKYASKAISMVMRIGRTYDKLDRVAWIDELLDQMDNRNLTAALKGRKVLLYRQSGRIDEAMELSAEIAKENPGTLFESAALFDLFNMYQKDLSDSVSAGEILTELKTKYPDDDQTLIARSDCGENVAGALMKRHTLPKPEQQPVAVTPTEYSLSQAFPNPFNPVTNFGYTIPEKSPVRLEVFDLKGCLIETLVNQAKEPGNYQVVWDASKYPSSVYLYKIQAGTYTETRKCLLIK